MAQTYYAFLSGVVNDNPLATGATTLNASALANMPAISSPDSMYLVLDPNGVNGLPEIVKVTAHTASATSCTIARGQQTSQGGAAAHSHPQNTTWVVAATPTDFDELPFRKLTTSGDMLYAAGARNTTRLPIGIEGQTLSSHLSQPLWANGYTPSTSAARPSVPGDGMMIFETDTKRVLVYNATATAWRGIRSVARAGTAGASSTTSGTSRLTIASDTFPDQGCSGRLVVSCTFSFTAATNVNDQFEAVIAVGGADLQPVFFTVPSTLLGTVTLTGSAAMAAGASKAVTVDVFRFFGAGTVNVNESSLTLLTTTFIPDP